MVDCQWRRLQCARLAILSALITSAAACHSAQPGTAVRCQRVNLVDLAQVILQTHGYWNEKNDLDMIR